MCKRPFIRHENGYRIEVFPKPDGGWNWRANRYMQARDNAKEVRNAIYPSKAAALQSARDWISQETEFKAG